ncbi:MAG: hypothetical protein E3J72_12325 [Planctomycetota bacterium]|nr:MAG: hypothetical protein E3J72_12325 [Planctomycetota bacterium]
MGKQHILKAVQSVLCVAVIILGAQGAFAAGTPSGTEITGNGSGTWSGGTKDSGAATTTVEAAYAMQMTLNPASDSGIHGTNVIYTFKVKNVSNCLDNLTFTITGNAWTTALSADYTGDLAADAEFTLDVTVTVPLGAADGETDSFTLTIRNQGGAGTEDNWPAAGNDTLARPPIVTTALAPDVGLAVAVDKATAKPYEDLTYTASYSNTGGANASSVELTFAIPANTVFEGTISFVSGVAYTVYYSELTTGDSDWTTVVPDPLALVMRIKFVLNDNLMASVSGSFTFMVTIK